MKLYLFVLIAFLSFVLAEHWTADDLAHATNTYQKVLVNVMGLFNAQSPPQSERAIVALRQLLDKDFDFMYVNGNNATETQTVHGIQTFIPRERIIAEFVDKVFMYVHPPIVEE